MLVVGLEHHRQGFASCHALIYHKNHTGPNFQPTNLYSSTVHKPTSKTENRKRVYQLLLIHPHLYRENTHTVYLRQGSYTLGCLFSFRHSGSENLEYLAIIKLDPAPHSPGRQSYPDKQRTVIQLDAV